MPDSTGLADKGDKLHFAAEVQTEMGARFAKAMQELQVTHPASAAATVELWPDGAMPGQGARQPEGEQPLRADNFHRITNVSRPTLTVFPAPKTDRPAPAMIVSPGGGYSYVVYDKEGTEIAAWLEKALNCPQTDPAALGA